MVFPTNFLYAAPNNQAVGYRVASFRTNRSPNAVLYGVDSFSSAVGLSLPNTWANPPLLIGPPPTF